MFDQGYSESKIRTVESKKIAKEKKSFALAKQKRKKKNVKKRK